MILSVWFGPQNGSHQNINSVKLEGSSLVYLSFLEG